MGSVHILELIPFVTDQDIFWLFQELSNYFVRLPVCIEILQWKTGCNGYMTQQG